MNNKTSPRAVFESLEDRRMLSVSPPNFNVYPQAMVWPAEHEFYPSVLASTLPINFSLLNAPKGMTIERDGSATYGPRLTWTPTATQTGFYKVTVVGTNSAGTLKVPITIQVTPDVPELNYLLNPSDGPTYGLLGVPMTIQMTDYSFSKSTYSIVFSPKGLSLNPSTGVIHWTPNSTQAGHTGIDVRAKNEFGQSDLTIQIPVYNSPAVGDIIVKTNGLNAPTLSWTPPSLNSQQKIAGYNIQLQAFGPGGVTEYSFDRNSTGTSFKLQGLPKGAFDFIPTITPLDAAGHLSLSATGPAFAFAPAAQVIVLPTETITGYAGKKLNFTVYDSNTSLPLTYAIKSGPKGMTIDQSGNVSWTPGTSQTGTQTIVLSATNSLGTITGSMQIPVTFPVPGWPASAWYSHATSTGFTVSWTAPSIGTDLVAGYNLYISYVPSDAWGPDVQVSYTVPANVYTFNFFTPVLGAFGASIAAFNSSGDEGTPDPVTNSFNSFSNQLD